MAEAETTIQELNQWMVAHHFHGYWTQAPGGPAPQQRAFLWRGADVVGGLRKATELAPTMQSGFTGPRKLRLLNPNDPSPYRAISLSAQILLPGERAGGSELTNEAILAVDVSADLTFVSSGETFPVEWGDLLVSPAGTAYELVNGGTAPAIVLMGSDQPLRSVMGMGIGATAGPGIDETRVVRPTGYAEATAYRMGRRSAGLGSRPPLRYAWADTDARLVALQQAGEGMDANDGLLLRYTSPYDGGSTTATFACEVQLLETGLTTAAHRHSSSPIYYVLRGSGQTVVGDDRLDWSQGDIFRIPPWTWHHHSTVSETDAILFSIEDRPAMARFDFYRDENKQ